MLTWVLTRWEAVPNFTDVVRDPRRIAVGPAGAVLAALIAVVIATGSTLAWVGSLAELGRRTHPTTSPN